MDMPLSHYPSDLNAMHEAEKLLTPQQRERYAKQLNYTIPGCYVRGGYEGEVEWEEQFTLLSATAAQRAEVFLRTLNLWV